MQCGPIRHTAAPPARAPRDLEVVPRTLPQRTQIPDEIGIQEIFRSLAEDQERTAAIADETQGAITDGRKVLVLTERTGHLDSIRRSLNERSLEPFVLHGRMSKGRRAKLIAELDPLAPDTPRILLATGRLLFASYMKDPAELLVPTRVQYELHKWVKRGSDESTALDTIAFADDSLVVPLSTDIALVAADVTLSHRLAFADAVTYASARKYNVELVTSDDHFEGLPGEISSPPSPAVPRDLVSPPRVSRH